MDKIETIKPQHGFMKRHKFEFIPAAPNGVIFWQREIQM